MKMKNINRVMISAVVIVLLILAIQPLGAQEPTQVTEECAPPSWQGSFYNSNDLSGSPIHVLCRRLIDFNWGAGQPFQGVNTDNFSTRWTTTQAFNTAGTWQINVAVQGGARLIINGQVVIDDMSLSAAPRVLTANYEVAQAGVPVSMMLEAGHGDGEAMLYVSWNLIIGGSPGAIGDHKVTAGTPPGEFNAGGGNVWWIEHFNNANLTNPPLAYGIHVSDGISYDYDTAAPKAGLNEDGFSSRWTRTVDFPAGTYTFTFRADDGGRVLVDGQQIISQPTFAQNGQTGTIQLTAGRHTIVVEHWDIEGLSSIFLTWNPPVGTMLFPDGCNAVYTAGKYGNAPICPTRGIATFGTP